MENPYTENTISEETRLMIMKDNHPAHRLGVVMNNLIDEITRPNHIKPKVRNHGHLLDELDILYEAHMARGTQKDIWEASMIKAAINVISTL
jgi:hypothetical protein